MKKITAILSFLTLLFISSSSLFSQTTYYSIAPGGAWNSSGTWGTSPGGPAGAGIPTINDDVIIQTGAPVNLVSFGTGNCRNFYFDATATGSIFTLGFIGIINISGTLLGYNGVPATNLITDSGGQFTFTGSNLNTTIYGQFQNNEIITLWNSNTPLPLSVFNLAGQAVIDNIVDASFQATNIVFQSQFTQNSGNLSFGPTVNNMILSHPSARMTIADGATFITNGNNQLRIRGANARLTIEEGGTITARGPINGDGPNSNVNILIINGTLTAQLYVNSTRIVIGENGLFTTFYSYPPNQTEGWWYQSNRPSIYNITGTIRYGSSGNQNVYPIPGGYGNLRFTGGGTKTFVGNTNPIIDNDFIIASGIDVVDNTRPIQIGGNFTNDGIWIPNVNMVFDGSVDQIITGSTSLTFGRNLRVKNTSGTVSLGSQDITINGILEIESDAVFNPGIRNVTLLGNIIAEGTLQAGTGTSTFNFAGTTNLIGTGTSFNNFNINNGGTVIGSASDPFSVTGNFINDGTFNNNNGTVIFNGSGSQSITETQELEFNNIEINNSNSAWVNVDGDVDLVGSLTLTTSTSRFDADGSGSGVFTLKSSALNQDARIAAFPSPSNFRGNVSVERYIDGVADEAINWRYMAVPITNANVGMWQATFPVTGNFSNPSTSSPETSDINPDSASIKYFDGSAFPYWLDVGTGGSTGSTSLLNGRGYSVYTYRSSDFVVTTKGTIGKGNISRGIASNAWALMGNPYPSTIDWDNMNTSGLYGAMYLQNLDGSFATYVKGSGSGTNHPNGSWAGEVSLGQSFWVYSEGATSVNFSESNKTSSPNYEFLRKNEVTDLISITLSNNSQKDQVSIRFMNDANDDFESQRDAIKLKNGFFQSELNMNSYINLSSYVLDPDVDMTINTLPFIEECNKSVFLKIQDVPIGEYNLTFNNIESFSLGYYISLKDNFTSEEIDILENAKYIFQVTSDSASFGAGRFELIFGLVEQPIITEDKGILYSSQDSGNQWYVDNIPIEGANGPSYDTNLLSGSYTVEYSSGSCTNISDPIVIEGVTGFDDIIESDLIRLFPNPASDQLFVEYNVITQNTLRLLVYSVQGKIMDSQYMEIFSTGHKTALDITRYPKGMYITVVYDGENYVYSKFSKQ